MTDIQLRWVCISCSAPHNIAQKFCYEGSEPDAAPLWFCRCLCPAYNLYKGEEILSTLLLGHEFSSKKCSTCLADRPITRIVGNLISLVSDSKRSSRMNIRTNFPIKYSCGSLVGLCINVIRSRS